MRRGPSCFLSSPAISRSPRAHKRAKTYPGTSKRLMAAVLRIDIRTDFPAYTLGQYCLHSWHTSASPASSTLVRSASLLSLTFDVRFASLYTLYPVRCQHSSVRHRCQSCAPACAHNVVLTCCSLHFCQIPFSCNRTSVYM
jgi:hypothetical protein